MNPVFNFLYKQIFWALSGLLLSFSFPNLGIPFLGYFALIPALYRSYKDGYFSVFFGVLSFSIVFWWITTDWFSTFHKLAPLGIIFALYLYSIIPFVGVSLFAKKYGEDGILVFPFLWVAFEFLRGNGYWSMPIILLAHTQYHFAFSNNYLFYILNGAIPMLSEWGGVYFVSFLVALINSLILIAFLKLKKSFNLSLTDLFIVIGFGFFSAGFVFSLISLITGFGIVYASIFIFSFLSLFILWFIYRKFLYTKKILYAYPILLVVFFFFSGIFVAIDRELWYKSTQGEEIKISLLQPNFSPWDKLLAKDFDKLNDVIDLYKSSTNADFVVACESILRDPVNFYYQRGDLFGIKSMSISKEIGKPMILTYPHLDVSFTNTFIVRDNKKVNILQQLYNYYNTALFFDSSGKVIGRYDKVHLVPFGEWTPFSEYIPPLREAINSIVGSDLTPGKEFKIVEVEVKPNIIVNMAPIICFEDLYPYISKFYRKMGADVLVNMTNDGWANSIKSQWQHLVGAIYRVIETGLPMVRATNTGRSAFILQNAKVISDLDDFKKGIMLSEIKLIKRNTFFVLFGDYLFTIILFVFNAFIIFLGVSGKNIFKL
ncbi:MAG: apolipoprotein N-acyltransferase [Brevinematia bacterium]